MARPKKGSWKKIKRLGRYLMQYPRLIWQFEDADVGAIEYVDVFSDSDWAGDKVERKSTSGGVAMIAGGVIKTWSSTQGTLSLSVGEAEYYALIKAAAEGLGIQSLAKDMGYDLKVRIWVDSTTAKAIAARIGLGKVSHMEVKHLWAQQAMMNQEFELRKFLGEKNYADIGAKPKSVKEMMELLDKMGERVVQRRGGHHSSRKRRCDGGEAWADFDIEEDE